MSSTVPDTLQDANGLVRWGGTLSTGGTQTFTNVVVTGTTTTGNATAATMAPNLAQISPLFTITSGAMPTTGSISSGTAFQVSTTEDAELYVPITTDGTNNAATAAVAISSDDVTFSTLYTMSVAAALNTIGAVTLPVHLRVPAGWWGKITVAHASIGTGTYY